jgi:[protein-PII] uridylyltransferase
MPHQRPVVVCPDLNPPASFAGDFATARPAVLEQLRGWRDHCAQLIRTAHRQGASGRQTVVALTAMTDSLTGFLAGFCRRDLPPDEDSALIALGGYGRGEMNPYSDIDLMFFSPGPASASLQELSQRMLYLLWDLGYDVSPCVRSRQDCLQLAEQDLTVATAMLDSRFLAGNAAVHDLYRKQVHAVLLNRNSQEFIRAKLAESEQRRRRFGSSVYLLEPNIKEGEGGLRDLHTAWWVCQVKYKLDSLRGLVIKGVISEEEHQQFFSLLEALWRIRNELHYLSPRKNDQLHFDKQEQLAAFFGYQDCRTALAVEQFMQHYYETASRVEHLASSLIARAQSTTQSEHRLLGYLKRRNIDENFFALRGEIYPCHDDLFVREPALMMQAFFLAQRHELALSLKLKTLIRENQFRINDRLRRSRAMAGTFLEILRGKKQVYEILAQMHHLLFLNHFIPEFRRIYCRVQHDAYHIYTVDTHTLFAVREITRLWQGVYRDKKPLLTRLAQETEKPQLLILAVLLHDIGKGQGSQHSEKGARMIPTIARRLGLGREDSLRLEFLVRHHLQMAYISQRRDLHDDNLIAQFAATMQMSENLNMLYLLTFADIKAVGPDVWTEWKGFLLQELYEKTYTVLEKGNFVREERSEKIRNRKRKVFELLAEEFDPRLVRDCLRNCSTRYLMAHRSAKIAQHLRVVLQRGDSPLAMQVAFRPERSYTEVIIVTLDVPGLFTIIAGVMSANGINILGAQIYTQKNGTAVDVLQVGSSDGLIYDDPRKWQKVEADLLWFLQGRGRVEEAVQKRRSSVQLSCKKMVPRVPPRVDIDNSISAEHTVIDISTRDEVGLLYSINHCLNQLGLYVGVAKITTKGERAGDTFYVQDIFGSKITQQEKLDELRRALLECLQ